MKLTMRALERAISARGAAHGLMFHSDRGVEYGAPDHAASSNCSEPRALSLPERISYAWAEEPAQVTNMLCPNVCPLIVRCFVSAARGQVLATLRSRVQR